MIIEAKEYDPYYKPYIEKVNATSVVEGLNHNLTNVAAFFRTIPQEKLEYRYAEGKWTVKDIILHLTDAERVFAYRALRIGRGDVTPLTGFDQDVFVSNGNANQRHVDSLISEYIAVRKASIALFECFGDDELLKLGIASGSDVSVRALGCFIIGHENHHCQIIKERYL